MDKKKILVFGEILWDIFGNEQFLSGAPFNFSAHSVRLGADCALITAIGNDALGKDALKKAKEYGIRGNFIQCSHTFPTGTTIVNLLDGEPRYELMKNTAYDNVEYSSELQRKINEFSANCFYFGTVGQRGNASADTLKKILKNSLFSHVFCDLNLRDGNYTKESIIFCLENCSILKINRQEIEVIKKMGLVDSSAVSIKDFAISITENFCNIKLLLITLDNDGAYIYDKENLTDYIIPAIKCDVVSPTGAGDAFCAGFITNYLKGASLQVAAQKGVELASYVLKFTEAIPN